MNSLRSILLAGTALSFLALPALAGTAFAAPSLPLVFAQAEEITDPAVLAAQKTVEDARAALRDAMANGGDVRAARKALNEALKALNEARVAAGLPPLGKNGDAAGGKPPKGDEQPPAAETETPPADQPPATADQPPADQPPAAAETPPADQPPATAEQPQADQPPATAEQPPDQPPAATSEESDEKQFKKKGKKKPPVEVEAPAETPAGEPPAAVTETPPADTLEKPKVGEQGPPREEGPPPQFSTEEGKPPVKTGADIKEGQEVKADDGRVISKEGGELTIQSDDDARFKREGRVTVEETKDGGSVTTVKRRNGVEIVTVRDRDGNIVQRFRKLPDGQVEVLIGAVEGPGAPPAPQGPKFPKPPKFRPGPGIPPIGAGGNFDFGRYLPPVEVQIPEDDYIVESRRASPRQIEEALVAPPVERVERPYTLEEIRRSERLRAKVRRIDIDTVTFDFGSAYVGDDQIPYLQAIGEALQRVIERDPNEVYLIEGHTDAVGSDLSNLALSDRRAESVAEILTYYFQIPPENLITQGYGEAYLKVPTLAPERENRRVTMRRITPLLQTGEYQQQQ
jgi:outer membrane protein OmpA-like peptidoglycan-associated protein